MRSVLVALIVLAVAGVATMLLLRHDAHHAQPWELTDIRGHMPDLRFHLLNDRDQPVTGASYRGKTVLLYFGYTHCPDVCPTTLAHLSVVMQNLGAAAKDVRVLFVSVDPKRDTPAVLHAYVDAFDPQQFVGLTGTPQQIARVAKRYRVAYSYGKPDAAGNYVVNHSAAIFIFDDRGRARLLATQQSTVPQLTHDLTLLLHEEHA